MVLTFHPDDPINAAAALRDLELRVGRFVTNRSTTPLFADAAGEPYTHHFLHSLLRAALAHLYGTAVASLYSFHSFRSGLASALHAAGVDDGSMIQLICRWMCPESLHVYRRMGVAGPVEGFIRSPPLGQLELPPHLGVDHVPTDAIVSDTGETHHCADGT